MGITRRDFTALGGITVLISIAGCGGDDDDGDFFIGANHPEGAHNIRVPASDFAADLASQQPKAYDIIGDSQHNHTVAFTAEQMQQLKAGQRIEAVCSLPNAFIDPHQHQVVVFRASNS